jgi:hypothetical protein
MGKITDRLCKIIDQLGRADDNQDDAQNPKNIVIEASVRLPDIVESIRHQEAAENKQYEIAKKGYRVAVFGFIVASVALVVYGIQMCANWRQADAAEMQLGAMTNQLAEMQRQRELDERAWVNIINPIVEFPAIETAKFGLQVQYLNTGKTPAKIKNVHIDVGISKQPFTNTEWLDSATGAISGTLAPNAPDYSVWRVPIPLSSNDIEGLKAHKRRYYFVWDVFYEDVFTNIHETKKGFTVGTWMNDDDGRILAPYGSEIMN